VKGGTFPRYAATLTTIFSHRDTADWLKSNCTQYGEKKRECRIFTDGESANQAGVAAK
jgi:hypothetical protein